MSKATGNPLAKYSWQEQAHDYPVVNGPAKGRVLTEGEKQKIMRQLGGYACQLFGLRFPTIGSIFESEDGYYIGECLAPSYVIDGHESLEDIELGPFLSEADYYSSLTTVLHAHAEQLRMGHHALRAPIPVPQEYPSFAQYYAATDL